MRALGLIAVLAVAAGLAGCGFHLEGGGALPGAMARTYLQSTSPNSDFSSSIRSVLRLRGSELVSSAEDADAVLVVSDDESGQRVLSVSARNIPREYEVYYAVTVALFAGGEPLMEPETLIVTRNYTYDETRVLGKSAEERLLRRALADDLARQVMRRIESAASAPALPVS